MTQDEFSKLDHEMAMANIHHRRAIYETMLREQREISIKAVIKRLAGNGIYITGTFQMIEEAIRGAEWEY